MRDWRVSYTVSRRPQPQGGGTKERHQEEVNARDTYVWGDATKEQANKDTMHATAEAAQGLVDARSVNLTVITITQFYRAVKYQSVLAPHSALQKEMHTRKQE